MRKLFATRWWIAVVAITAVLVLAGGRAAYAYFTSSGSGTGAASVGSPGMTDWSVTVDTGDSTIGPIYPGSGNDQIVFDVQNDGDGDEQFSTATAAVDEDESGDIEEEASPSPTPVSSCTAGWFTATVTNDPRINTDVSPGGTVQVTVKVTMKSDSVDQDGCEGATPNVTLSVS
ncbi:MAG TPA: hypothetical protein VME19_18045 [Streptosporangiaceae bacterium]|nr:hypothetical protein [Streptosporangiaceae bacterium]